MESHMLYDVKQIPAAYLQMYFEKVICVFRLHV